MKNKNLKLFAKITRHIFSYNKDNYYMKNKNSKLFAKIILHILPYNKDISMTKF
jgi:hypothetical protein